MTVSDLASDPTSILVAGAIFSIALIAIAVIAIMVVRRVRGNTTKLHSANEVHISDLPRAKDSGLRIKPDVTGDASVNPITVGNQTGAKIIKKELEKVAVPQVAPKEAITPPPTPTPFKLSPVASQSVAKSVVEIAPKPMEKAPETGTKEQSAGTEAKPDDPFNIFSEISMDQSPTSKFAATLKDVDIHDLNEQAQTLIRSFRARTQ
jgi:hypothetical protein